MLGILVIKLGGGNAVAFFWGSQSRWLVRLDDLWSDPWPLILVCCITIHNSALNLLQNLRFIHSGDV